MRAMLLVLAVAVAASASTQDYHASSPQFHIRFVLEGTADAWRHADAVVYARIDGTKGWREGRIAQSGGLSVLHDATAILVAKAHPVGGPTGRTLTFVQAGSSHEMPYATGQQFIAFLKWSEESGVFVRSFGPDSVYPVSDGDVDWVYLERDTPFRKQTMKVEDFLAKLRALATPDRKEQE